MRLLNLFFFMFTAFVGPTNAFTGFHVNENNELITDCQFTYVVDNEEHSVTITTLDAPHIKVKVLDSSWDPVFVCTDNCSNPIVVNNLPVGEYIIAVMYFNDAWENTCITNENFEVSGGPCIDNDEDGLCAFEDCNDYDATLPQAEGTACNDYDGTTINDLIQADGCTCMGTPYQGGCDINYSLNADAGFILVTGLIAHSAKLRLYDPSDFSTVYDCGSDCGNNVTIEGIPAGYYNIDIILYDEGFNEICSLNENFTWDPAACTDADSDGICANQDCDDNNAALPGQSGTPCNDNNSATVNDVVGQSGCTCAGEVYEGLCDISYVAGNNKLNISGLIAPHVKVRLFDADWNTIFECQDDCDQELEITGLTPNAVYYFKARLMNEDWETICGIQDYIVVQAGNSCPDSDEDGYCDDIDCDSNDPAWPKAPGTPCDDGLDDTVNDVIQADGCSCAGEAPSSDPCTSIYISNIGGILHIGGFPAGYIPNVKVFTSNWYLLFECTASCEDPTKLAQLPTGTYIVKVKLLDSDWDQVCGIQEEISMLIDNPEGMQALGELDSELELELELKSSAISAKVMTQPSARLYPNPVTADLHINMEGMPDEALVLEIYNQLGQVVKRQEVASWPEGALVLNCEELNPGVYYLVVRTAAGLVVSKQFVRK